MINGKIIYSHVSIVLKILYFRQISDGKQIIFIIFTPFIISNHCLQHVLLVQFHLRHSNGVKCLKLGSADIELWRSEKKPPAPAEVFRFVFLLRHVKTTIIWSKNGFCWYYRRNHKALRMIKHIFFCISIGSVYHCVYQTLNIN